MNEEDKLLDPESVKFYKYLEGVLSKPKEMLRLRADILYYLAGFFEDFTDAEIKAMCLDKSIRGAKVHGPDMLSNIPRVKKEKLEEVIDLINYTVIQEYQKNGK